jgi:hypothetical protein
LNVFNPAKVVQALQCGYQKDLLTSDYHARKYSRAYGQNLFTAANQAGATLSAGLATTYVGLCVSNPAGSGKNLALMNVSGLIDVAPAAILGLGLIVGYSVAGVVTHTTALTPFSSFVGTGPAPVAKADAACTLVGTPEWARFFDVSLASTNQPSFFNEIDGGIILPPGAYAAIGATVAGPTSGFFGSMEWEEAPQ